MVALGQFPPGLICNLVSAAPAFSVQAAEVAPTLLCCPARVVSPGTASACSHLDVAEPARDGVKGLLTGSGAATLTICTQQQQQLTA
jgi:hypothetical protein